MSAIPAAPGAPPPASPPPPPPAPPRRAARPRPARPQVLPERCTGCGRCVAVCGPHVLSLETVRWIKTAVLDDAPRCTGCALCAKVCPFGAIRMGPGESGNPAAG